MEYLKDYVSSEVYEKLISLLSLDVQSSLSKNKDNIIKIFKYFKSIGINKFDDLLLFRCDLLFEDVESLKDKINKMDTSFVSFIIQNDVGNLINLGI
ncbi:hypothetical protein MSH26_02220 [bacterium]|nr:hypothetical protein [bacterium]MDY3757545.1 hypothetical protein [Bacilli bacterium]